MTFTLAQTPELPKKESAENPHALPPLPYAYNALEPWIDTETMHLHHDKHHRAYVDKLNTALKEEKPHRETYLEEIIEHISMYSKKIRDNAGGHWNHSFFWEILSPHKADHVISKQIEDKLREAFLSTEKFKEEFEKKALSHFGSGWVWLIVDAEGNLKITTTPNQDNPLMDLVKEKGTPLLACDLWEHAYYLKYRNNKEEYLKSFWKIVNWSKVDELMTKRFHH